MKPKIIKNYTNKENPYQLFSFEYDFSNIKQSRNNIPKSSRHMEKYTINCSTRPKTSYGRLPSAVSSISKSLKSVTLSSKNYGDYIDLYSKITQEHTFKTPKMTKYPLLKNKKFLPITSSPITLKDNIEEKKSFSIDTHNTSNSLFLSFMKEIKPIKKVIEEKPYGFKYGQTKIRFDRAKSSNGYMTSRDFTELYEHNIFETKFLKFIGLKKIDIYNNSEEKKKNFNFFKEYIKKPNELKEIFNNETNFHRSILFNGKTSIKKENIDFKLDIYSLHLKFYSLNNNKDKKNENQKLYFPYELLPLFYLLDLTTFKVFLSEIITYDPGNNCFIYIKENLLFKKIKRYCHYISHSLEHKPKYISNITLNKTETNYPLTYDWIVSKTKETNDNYQCFKVKIVLPKIKFSVENLKIKIIKFLNKHMIANLLLNKFKNWQKFIFFDLFTIKRFKIITNLIMLNKHHKIKEKKIYLNKRNNNIQNKVYEFFLSQIGENNSHFYKFVPYIILILFGEKNKKFQKINLTLRESKNLVKFGKNWGIMDTLFKCMFIDKSKDKILFKFDLLEDDKNELQKIILEENKKNNNGRNDNMKQDINGNNNGFKKLSSKNNNIMKDKEKDIFISKYKDKMFEISLLNCSLLKINITTIKTENKYYTVPPDLINIIFRIKDENKIFNTNNTDIPIISKYIGENSKLILSAEEADIIAEEQAFIKKAKIKDEEYKIETTDKIPRNLSSYDRLQTFKMLQNNTNLTKETNKEEIKEELKDKIKAESVKFNKKFINPKKFGLSKGYKKKLSISNLNALKKSRIEYGTKDKNKKKTSDKIEIKEFDF